MKKWPLVALGVGLAVALACFTFPKRASSPVDPPPAPAVQVAVVAAMPANPPAVDLEESFVIPEGKSISHTPAVVFTPDGKSMLTATSEREITVFDVATRKIARRIRFEEDATDAVSIDSGGRYAVWSLRKGGIAVVEIGSGKVLARGGDGAVGAVAVAPDAKSVAMARGALIEVRSLPDLGGAVEVAGHAAEVTNLAWSADARVIGSTARDGRVIVHDVGSRERRYEAKKATALYAIAFRPGGAAVAYGGDDKQVYQYDFAAGARK